MSKVPVWGIVLSVVMIFLVVLLILGLVVRKFIKKLKKDDKSGGNSMSLLRGSFKDKASKLIEKFWHSNYIKNFQFK